VQYAGGTWASGGSLNTGREQLAGTGTVPAALAFAGNATGIPSSTLTESYNGTSWTEVNDLNTGRSRLGASSSGPNTATIAISGGVGGTNVANTESWNGTSWTEVNDVNQVRVLFASFGLQTAAIAATGEGPPGGAPHLAAVESWNGTSWSEVAEVNTPRRELPGVGVQTAGLIISGNIDPPITTNVESWDGSAWTEIANVNTGRNNGASAGTQTSALLIAGNAAPGVQPSVEYWDGTSWTEINDVANASYVSGFGTGTTTAWKAGGLLPGITAVTEEFSAPSLFSKENLGQVFYNSTANAFKVTQQSIPAGTWSSGGDLNEAKAAVAGAGTKQQL
jgi:hypothetical protein